MKWLAVCPYLNIKRSVPVYEWLGIFLALSRTGKKLSKWRLIPSLSLSFSITLLKTLLLKPDGWKILPAFKRNHMGKYLKTFQKTRPDKNLCISIVSEVVLHCWVKFSLHKVGIEPDHTTRHCEPHHGVSWSVASRIVMTAHLATGSEHLQAGVMPGLVYLGDTSHLVQDLNWLSVSYHISDLTVFKLPGIFYLEKWWRIVSE